MQRPKKFFLVMCAVIVLSIGGTVAGFLWGSKQLKLKTKEVSELMADRDLQNDTIEKLKASNKSAQDSENIKQLVTAALPKQKQQENLLSDILHIATTTQGMSRDKLSNITFSGGSIPDALSGAIVYKEIPGLYTYPFSVQINDISYSTFLNILARFEINKRIVQVDQLQITPNAQKADSLSVSISFKAYIQP